MLPARTVSGLLFALSCSRLKFARSSSILVRAAHPVTEGAAGSQGGLRVERWRPDAFSCCSGVRRGGPRFPRPLFGEGENALQMYFCVSWKLSHVGVASRNQPCLLTGLFWDEAGKFPISAK